MRQKDQHNTALTDKAILICDYLLMVGKVQIRQISNGEGRDPQCVNFRQVPSRKNVESGLHPGFRTESESSGVRIHSSVSLTLPNCGMCGIPRSNIPAHILNS